MAESSLRNEMTALQQELKWFHLRVMELQRGLRSTQKEVESLKTELAQSHENEEKLEKSHDELKEKYVGLEARIKELENKNDSQQRSSQLQEDLNNDVLRSLDELNQEIRIKFKEWNGKQVSLEKDVEIIKESLKKPPAAPTENDPLRDLMNENEDDIQILASPTCTVPSSPLSPIHGDVFDFSEDGPIDLEPRNVNSPIPGPSSRMHYRSNPLDEEETSEDPKPSGCFGGSSTRHSTSRSCDKRWSLQHGTDGADPNGTSCLCGTRLASRRSLDMHIHHFTGDWKFTCKKCGKIFPRGNMLNAHLRRDHKITLAEKVYGCVHCGKSLPLPKYRVHVNRCKRGAIYNATSRYARQAPNRKPVSPPPQRSLMAPSTPTNSGGPSKSSIHPSHFKTVSPIKIKIANGKAVKTMNSSRRRPENASSNETTSITHGKDHARDFTCLCGLKFNDYRGLNHHVNYYTIKRFQCKYCKRWFAYACYRNAHVLRSHKNIASSNSQSQSLNYPH